jgi:hypothetical protein
LGLHWRLIGSAGVKHDHTLMFNHAQAEAALFHLNPAHIVGTAGWQDVPETVTSFRPVSSCGWF